MTKARAQGYVKSKRLTPLVFGLMIVLSACSRSTDTSKQTSDPKPNPTPSKAAPQLQIPIEYYHLANGLKVVLSPDHNAPLATVGVYYNIGFRIEPKDRTGFAHLFEHMMFQGSGNLGKNEFFKLVQGVGGVLNGSTRFDYTNYYEAFPANALETMLWAEADRMRGLDINADNLKNQQGVVTSEVKVNVLNQPYGGFPWLDMPQHANRNWYNAHNFYGDLGHIEAATLTDVRSFFATYYVPNNAALVVIGDFDPAQAKQWIEKYFGSVASGKAITRPDISEAPQTEERRAERTDNLAPQPALAIAYHTPPRSSPEYYALSLIDEILLQGADSRLHQELVQKRGLTDEVFGGINLQGTLFDYDGPMLFTIALLHDTNQPQADIIAAIDAQLSELMQKPVSAKELARARTKIRSALYDLVGSSSKFGLSDLLGAFALFDDNPNRINSIEAKLDEVTPELIQSTAQKYLRPEQRTVLTVKAGGAKQ